MSNKDTLVTAMRELFGKKDVTALDRYFAEPYIQHSPGLPNGLEGLRNAVPHLDVDWQPERIFEDGDYVIAHSLTKGWLPEGDAAIVDIFRFENGRIVEHWDVKEHYVPVEQTVSGNSMV